MRLIIIGLLCLVSPLSIAATPSQLKLTVTLPQLEVAEYHAPYVAIWIEDEKRKPTHVALWYDVAMAGDEGQDWLKDLRQWWRRGGRGLSLPVDGLTGATRGPGQHTISAQLTTALATLAPGKYHLMVEAAREVGGREVLQLPLQLPLTGQKLPAQVSGQHELSAIRLHF